MMIHFDTAVPNGDNSADERRAERRRRVLKGGRIVYNGGQSVAEGVIRDLSEKGLRLRMGETTAIPSYCEVGITGMPDLQDARVVWRTRFEMGLALA